MKSVCSVLGVVRSNLHVRHHRSGHWQDNRRGRTPAQDELLLADLRRHIAELPSYGYRRAGALLNRERRSQDHPPDAFHGRYPPNGWKCRCRVQPLTASAVRRNDDEVESAEDHIQEVDVPQRDGSTIKVKRLTLPGMDRPFQPDVGWDYNPAADYQGGQP